MPPIVDGVASILTVMIYNVGNGMAGPKQLIGGLRGCRAEIIGLVEATSHQAGAMRDGLRTHYPFQVHTGDGIPGKAVVSQHPILTPTPLDLHPDRPDLLVVVEVGGRRLRVLIVHPPPPRLHRTGIHFTDQTREQFDELLEIASTGEPTILLGDFNMLERHEHHARLVAAGFVDSFREAGAGRGFTYPRRHGRLPLVPVLRLDYVWHSPHLRAVSAYVGADAGSDHLPVIVGLTWNATPRTIGERPCS